MACHISPMHTLKSFLVEFQKGYKPVTGISMYSAFFLQSMVYYVISGFRVRVHIQSYIRPHQADPIQNFQRVNFQRVHTQVILQTSLVTRT